MFVYVLDTDKYSYQLVMFVYVKDTDKYSYQLAFLSMC